MRNGCLSSSNSRRGTITSGKGRMPRISSVTFLSGRPVFIEREAPAPYRIWGEGLEPGALDQMKAAARLPVAVQGALMPDAHQGYGLPIGGVLATENAVIPYAVGVDIACRMKLSVFDIPADQLKRLFGR